MTWTEASATELALATLPSQLEDPAGMNCSLRLKHACIGHPRFWHFNVQPPLDAKARASLVWRGSSPSPSHPQDALASFAELLHRRVLSEPQCTFEFLGDSMSNDGWVAAVAAAMRLGLKLSGCKNGGALSNNYWKHEAPLYGQPALCPQGSTLSATATFLAPGGSSTSCPTARDGNGKGASITLRYQNLPTTVEAAARVLNGSSLIMANTGLHANSQGEYAWLLEVQARPLLQALASAPGRVILWRESTPQHFVTACGSGLWEDRTEQGDAVHACAAVTNRTRANWRNEQFARWLNEWPADVRRRVLVVKAFDFLLERHDLHAPLDGEVADCTHFLHSPFVWAHIWDGAHSALRLVNRTVRATTSLRTNPGPAASGSVAHKAEALADPTAVGTSTTAREGARASPSLGAFAHLLKRVGSWG